MVQPEDSNNYAIKADKATARRMNQTASIDPGLRCTSSGLLVLSKLSELLKPLL